MRGAGVDVVELVTSDHRVVEQLFRQLEAAVESGHEEVQRETGHRIVRELSVHTVVEEQVLYPVVRDVVAGGDELVDRSLREHRQLKGMLADLDGLRPADEEFVDGFGRLQEAFQDHVSEEETELLVELEDAADRDRLFRMGRLMEQAKRIAPTRPHPHAPDTPPGNIVAGALTGPIDRLRDAGREALESE